MPNIPLKSTLTRFCNSMIFERKSHPEVEGQWKSEKCISMRQSFHRALTTCRAPLPPGKKYVAVQFLTKELIFYVVDTKGKGQEIFDEASKHLGLSDTELFGLAFHQDGEYIFIDLNLKISKYAVRSWKTHINGIGVDGLPMLILHMRIKYYVDCHLLINEKIVRHHYYLQLRENVKQYGQPISEEKSFLLAALALQADLGNYNQEKHVDRYFEIANYFPSWIVKKIGEDFIVRSVPALHRDNAGMSRGEAQVGYIKGASDPPAPHNMHLYRMRRKKGKVWGDVWMGVGDTGIHIYEEVENIKSLLSTFSWCDIAKLHFEKKKFEILSEGSPDYRRFTYFVQSEELAKNVLWICRTTHHFHMANQSRVTDLKKLELDGGKPYREAYIYTDKVDQAREKQLNTLQRNYFKSKVENCTVNFNGEGDPALAKKSPTPLITKMSGVPWENGVCLENGQCVSSHHSMETLPLTNGCRFSPDLKFKSQSIPCLPDCSFKPYSASDEQCNNPEQHWCPSNINMSATSTLLSRSSCTSNTDSTCSFMSLTSDSTLKCPNDSSHWVKCDSFEELPLKEETVLQKVCISTFSDKHVRTASVYDSVVAHKQGSKSTECSPTARTYAHDSVVDLNFIDQKQESKSTECLRTYATSSLEPSPSAKLADVKRSPSFNVESRLKITPVQKPRRQYVANRVTPRIGISSLSREQRLPLTLFNDGGIVACGSEPNLYDQNASAKSTWLQRKLNSQSEMSLNVLDRGGDVKVFDATVSQTDGRGRQSSLPDICSEGSGVEVDFPFIPPPPAYRNEIGTAPVDAVDSELQKQGKNSSQKTTTANPADPNEASPDVLDIQQLRQRSRDLDLPLISALCNDRSLLMLPKTVPTCSRQRHLGKKDPLRFSRTTSLPDGDGLEALLVNSGRPISWHVDSRQVSHTAEVSKPCSASWDYSIKREEVIPVPRTVSLDNDQVLPPTWNQRPTSVDCGNLPPTWNHINNEVQHPTSVDYCSRPPTTNRMNNEVQRPNSMDYGNYVHYPLMCEARTVSLDNGIHQSEVPRTVLMDHPHYLLNKEVLRPRTASLENGIHRGLDPRTHYLLAMRQRTTSLENGIHRCMGNEVRSTSMDYNHHCHPPLPRGTRTISLENGIYQGVQNQRTVLTDNGFRPLPGLVHPTPSLPPTILTSFVKTPVKHVKGFRDHSASDSYRYDKSQMIPMKLLAGSLSNIANGRMYQKGLSS